MNAAGAGGYPPARAASWARIWASSGPPRASARSSAARAGAISPRSACATPSEREELGLREIVPAAEARHPAAGHVAHHRLEVRAVVQRRVGGVREDPLEPLVAAPVCAAQRRDRARGVAGLHGLARPLDVGVHAVRVLRGGLGDQQLGPAEQARAVGGARAEHGQHDQRGDEARAAQRGCAAQPEPRADALRRE
jgi:hypothetical protein